jgi:hypothetical protein
MVSYRIAAAALFSALICASDALAFQLLEGCDFNRDQAPDEVQVLRRRRARIQLSGSGRIMIQRFGRPFARFECADLNGDGRHEILAYPRRIHGQKAEPTAYYLFGKPKSKLDQVCRTVRELQSCEIWKAITTPHIADQRKVSTSFITRSGCAGIFPECIEVFDRLGEPIHTIGQYFPTLSPYDSRHYGCWGCGDCRASGEIADEAQRETGSASIYLRDRAGACVRVPDAGTCYNSSEC